MNGTLDMRTNPQLTKQSRGLIRSLNRRAVRDDKAPQVVRKTPPIHEPTVCARCGAVFVRKTWRHDHTLSDEQIDRARWGFCPACEQVSRHEGQGRLIIRGVAPDKQGDLRRRIENAAKRAMRTQPERRIASIDTTNGGGAIEVLTTSQKLAHRLAHEVKKLLRGKVSYSWSDDGTLFATWTAGERLRKERGTQQKNQRIRSAIPAG
jgi:NMD protein affecting ribosome stability and mRNA decay